MKRQAEIKNLIRKELMHYAGTEVHKFYHAMWEVYRKLLMSGHSCSTPLGKLGLQRQQARLFNDMKRRVQVHVGARTAVKFRAKYALRNEIKDVEILDASND